MTDMHNPKAPLAKKIIIIAILACLLLLVFVEREKFYEDAQYVNGVRFAPISDEVREEYNELIKEDPNHAFSDIELFQIGRHSGAVLPLSGNMQVENSFLAKAYCLTEIRLRFYNPKPENVSGTVTASLEDEEGNVLGESSLSTDRIYHNKFTDFSYVGRTDYLNANGILDWLVMQNTSKGIYAEGKTLRLVVSAQDITGEGFGIYLSNDRESTPDDPQFLFGEIGRNLSLPQILFYCILILLCTLLVLLPESVRKSTDSIALQILFYATPFFCCFFLRKISGFRIVESLQFFFTLPGILNLLIIAFIWWLVYTVSGRKRFSITLTVCICLLLGLANFFLLEFRDSPLLATDLSSALTGLQLAGNYDFSLDKYALSAIVFAICWLSVCWTLSEHREASLPPHKKKKRFVSRLLIAVAAGIFLYLLLFQTSLLRNHDIRISGFKPKTTYKENGYALSFAISASNLHIEKPSGYSPDGVRAIAEKYSSDAAEVAMKVSEQTPNIIVIVNEAFSDLRANGDIPTNEEFMPFFYSLKKNTISGKAYTSVLGGRTATAEFEFLTGFTDRFLPFFSVPYTSLIDSAVPNYTSTLRDAGYGGLLALHPGTDNSYNRNKVYPLLGFKDYISLEDLDHPDFLRSYVSDAYDYAYAEQLYEDYKTINSADAPFYLFNVTIQNHSDYRKNFGIVDAGITIEEPTLNDGRTQNYLNLIKKSDEALENLINYFSNVGEPTLIILFGDHQPALPDEIFTDVLTELSGKETNEENKYIVPFIIWANYDIPEKTDELISLNYIASYVQQLTGGPMTGYNKYLMDLYEKLPVISDRMVIDSEGNMYALGDKNPHSDLLHEYQMVQYNGFIDKKHRVDEFFYLTS